MGTFMKTDLAYIPEILAAGLRAAGVTLQEADTQAQALYLRVLREYQAAGEPCGPGHQGMMQWLVSETPAISA
jgi:hypothetical protein